MSNQGTLQLHRCFKRNHLQRAQCMSGSHAGFAPGWKEKAGPGQPCTGAGSPPGNFSHSCGRQLEEFSLLHSEAKFRQLSLISWLFSISSQRCNGLHGVSSHFWALNLPPLVGLTGSSAWVLHSFPPHSCNQPKGVIFPAEIETCESSSLFPQEMQVQLGLDESLAGAERDDTPCTHRHPQGPSGDGWGTGALPAARTLPRAWLGALGCRRGSKAWQELQEGRKHLGNSC